MCGICGIVNADHPVNQAVVWEMVGNLRHRGPDFQDVYVDDRVGLGSTRLSILDLSPSGNQPMSDAEGEIWIVHNGEVYNFPELRRGLERDGVDFKSQTDTEVIIYLYKKYGVDCLQYLRGMFAFALWDSKRNRLFLARDRMGQKPLLYAMQDGNFIFASEMQSMVAHPSIKKSIDLQALDLYLSYQFIPAPHTIFNHVHKLPPAHFLLLENGWISIKEYWQLDYTSKLKITEEDAKARVQEKILEAVELRLVSDVPLGALLSGGVDSSVVVALMSKLLSEPVETYSIGFEEREFNELPYAREVASVCSTNHHEFVVEPDLVSVLPRLARHYGEPYADKSAVPSYYVSQIARKGVTVALNGDGGDELFGGYPKYKMNVLVEELSQIPWAARAHVLRALESLPGTQTGQDLASKVKRNLRLYFFPEARVLDYKSFFNADLKKNLYADGVAQELADFQRQRNWELLEAAYRYTDDSLERMLWIDNHTYLPDDLLVKMDIASMANSLEVRSPFLDHELIELVARLPSRYKIQKGVTKKLLKDIGGELLPDQVIFRPKMGFSLPVNKWLREDLREMVEDTLIINPKGVSIFFDIGYVQELISEHMSLQRNHGFRLWALMNFELWYREFG